MVRYIRRCQCVRWPLCVCFRISHFDKLPRNAIKVGLQLWLICSSNERIWRQRKGDVMSGKVSGDWIIEKFGCIVSWSRYSASPSGVSEWIGYSARLALSVTFSTSVAGGRIVLVPNRLPPPPPGLPNGSLCVVWLAGCWDMAVLASWVRTSGKFKIYLKST